MEVFSRVVVEISPTAFALLPEDENPGCKRPLEVYSADARASECFGSGSAEQTTNHRVKFLEEKLKDLDVNVVVVSDNSLFTSSSLKLCGGWSEICAVRIWLMHFIQTTAHTQNDSAAEQLEAGSRCEAAVAKRCTESSSNRPRRSLRNRDMAKEDKTAKAALLSTIASSKRVKTKRLKRNGMQMKRNKVPMIQALAPSKKRGSSEKSSDKNEEMSESYATCNTGTTDSDANVGTIVAPVNVLTDSQFAAEKSVIENDGAVSIQTLLVECASETYSELSQQIKEPLGFNELAGKLTLRCHSCDYVAGKQRNLLMHEARKHGDRSYICPTCNRTFAVVKDLNQHLKCHTERYCCEHCGRTLKSRHALALHVARIHKGAAPWPLKRYLCTLCGKMCRNKTDYNIHCNKEHTGIRPFHCDVCNARFFSKCNLHAHCQVLFSIVEFYT